MSSGAPSGGEAGLLEIQRSRLLAGAVSALEQFGYEQATVAQITARARVSRRTFYEIFENREECLTALVEDVVGALEGEIAAAGLGELAWRERIRGGLWVILAFFDREPTLARVCMVQTLRGGPKMLAVRERTLARLAAVIDQGRRESVRARECAALTAEGLVGAAFSIVHARLLGGAREPLSGLVGELMGMIVLPYLGPAAARRERTQLGRPPTCLQGAQAQLVRLQGGSDPLQGVPMRLTYRTSRTLLCIAANRGVSNRGVGERAGIADQGQVSKLLARLERLGLIANTGLGHLKGEANAWTLTPLGERIAQHLTLPDQHSEKAA